MNQFSFIDLFAGIGGIRIPFDELGGKCMFSSEWDTHSQKTYFDNFGEIPAGDITKISPEQIPTHDLLLAGFPCQPFSQAGLKKGFEDIRGTLFFSIANILNYHRPKAILLENVKRFRTHEGGNTFRVVKNTLEKLGYKVFDKILNAKNFGIPQNRERIFIVGLLDHKSDFNFPDLTKIKTCVGDILEKTVDEKYTISDKLWAGHQRRKKEHIAKGFGFGYCLFDKNSGYTSTISAGYYKDGSEILIKQKNKNPRKLTPREAARLQGFPDSYRITVSDTQAYRQFGNSVAVPVIRAVAGNLISAIKKSQYKHSEYKIHNPEKYIPKNIYDKINEKIPVAT